MTQPNNEIADSHQASAIEQRAAWAKLSHLQRLAQVCSYRALQRSGRQAHHPYAAPIGDLSAPYSAAA